MTPRPYQIEGRDFLAARRFALLADQMRVGKTPQAILAAEKLDLHNILVVCPAIAQNHWHNEWRRWSERAAMPHLQILSYDMLRRTPLSTYDLAIVDECHFAKNPNAQRTRLVYGKNGVAWRAGRTWALSGTPAPRHAGELWAMMRAFGVVGCTYDEFVSIYCRVDETGRVVGTKESKIPELRAMLSTFMLRRTRAQVRPDMEEIGFEFLEIDPLGTDLAPLGARTDEDILAWCEANPAASAETRHEVAMAKVPALVEEVAFAIENDLLRQTVVFGWHVEPLTAFATTLNQIGVRAAVICGATTPEQRQRIQNDFRSGDVQVICANILAAGTAIDLSSASHGYFLELDWVPGNNSQAASRLVSLDRTEPVTFDVATWPGSTDDRVQRVLLRRVKELSKLY